jgi:hypothetical protein
MAENQEEIARLLKELTEKTNNALESYAVELRRINANLVGAHKAMTNHFELIQSLAAQGNSQTKPSGFCSQRW